MKKFSLMIACVICFVMFCGCCGQKPKEPQNSGLSLGSEYRLSAVPKEDKQEIQQQSVINTVRNETVTTEQSQMRAVWLSYIDLSPMLTGKTAQQFTQAFDRACDNIEKLGCNTIFVHVRPFGDALYKSSIYPMSKYVTGTAGKAADFDPLQIMVDIAHSHKLSIHAWINPLRLENADSFAFYDSRYLIKKWFDSSNGYICTVNGDKHLWLDPGYSEVRKMIADGAAEIVRLYDVDGIHFDDYFYPTTDESFDKACFSSSNTDKTLSNWRLDNISAMVADIYNAVKSVRSSAVVGVSPQGNIENNYQYMYADVKKWGTQRGFVDYICPQIYFGYNNPVKPFLKTLEDWENIVDTRIVRLTVGLAVYKVIGTDTEFVQTQGIIAKQIGDIITGGKCQGFALYSYNHLFDTSPRAKAETDGIRKLLAKS